MATVKLDKLTSAQRKELAAQLAAYEKKDAELVRLVGAFKADLEEAGFTVCVWPWHLELTRPMGEHRADGEHGGCVSSSCGEGDDVGRALGLQRRAVRVDIRSNDGLGDVPAVGSVDVSRQAATDGAATPRSGCSTAWATA